MYLLAIARIFASPSTRCSCGLIQPHYPHFTISHPPFFAHICLSHSLGNLARSFWNPPTPHSLRKRKASRQFHQYPVDNTRYLHCSRPRYPDRPPFTTAMGNKLDYYNFLTEKDDPMRRRDQICTTGALVDHTTHWKRCVRCLETAPYNSTEGPRPCPVKIRAVKLQEQIHADAAMGKMVEWCYQKCGKLGSADRTYTLIDIHPCGAGRWQIMGWKCWVCESVNQPEWAECLGGGKRRCGYRYGPECLRVWLGRSGVTEWGIPIFEDVVEIV